MLKEKTPPVAIAGWQTTEGAVMRREAAKRNDTPQLDADGNGRGTALQEEPSKKSNKRPDTASNVVLDAEAKRAKKMRALAEGNRIRIDRGRIKRKLHTGELDFDVLLDEMPDSIVKVPVVDLLTWVPAIGKFRAKKVCDGLVHTETLPVGSLSPKTKRLLGGRVDRYVQGYRNAPYAITAAA